jgi:hypothetical protein
MVAGAAGPGRTSPPSPRRGHVCPNGAGAGDMEGDWVLLAFVLAVIAMTVMLARLYGPRMPLERALGVTGAFLG